MTKTLPPLSNDHRPDHRRVFHPPAWLARIVGPLASRPRLMLAILVGLLVGAGLAFIPNGLRLSTRVLVAWDAAVGWFCGSMLYVMAKSDDCDMRIRARVQDEGQHFILAMVLIAAAFSIGAIAKELSLAKTDHDLVKAARIALAFLTVVLSWFLVQLIFALHYAHEYYAPGEGEHHDAIAGGLQFPDDDTPDYWDFLYFAVVLGVASQTADVSFKTKGLRRTGTVHGVIAFTLQHGGPGPDDQPGGRAVLSFALLDRAAFPAPVREPTQLLRFTASNPYRVEA